jgi:hypothetical protein
VRNSLRELRWLWTRRAWLYAVAVALLGAFLNGLVMSQNNWKMAHTTEGWDAWHIPMPDDYRLKFLADVIPLGPRRLSVGDVLIFGGLGAAIIHLIRGLLSRPIPSRV